MSLTASQNDLRVNINNRQILKTALPISVAILIPQVNFITNNIFLGHYSTNALAIASITGVYYLIFASIGFGMNNGLQTLLSRRAGQNQPEAIGKLFTQGVYISLCVAAVGILITYFLTPPLLRHVIRNSADAEQAITFLYIRIWGLPFLYVYQLRNALLVSIHRSSYLIGGTVAEALSNVLFDYLLIFGKLGFPALGFNGAAISSIIAEFTGMFVIFLVIHRKGITKQFAIFTTIKWDTKNTSLILSTSAPLAFQQAVSIMSWEFFYILIERNNTETALAVSNAMRNIFGIFGSFTWAFAAACSSMVSNIIGQHRHDLVPHVITKIVKLSTGITVIVFIILNLMPRLFLSIYGQSNDFIEQGIPVIVVISLATVLMSFSAILINSVIGTGNTRVSLLIEMSAIILYSVYVYLVLEEFKLGIVYGWMSEWLYWLALFVPSFFYIRSGKWRRKVL